MRHFDLEVTVKVFGLGGMMEREICKDVERSYGTAAELTNEYIRDNLS